MATAGFDLQSVSEFLKEKLRFKFNFSLKHEQYYVLEEIVHNETKEIVAVLPTGFGKSLIYQALPFLLHGPVIVFTPLTVIMTEQAQKLKNTDLKCCILNTRGRLVSYTDETEVLDLNITVPIEDITKCDIIFAHPEAFFSTDEGKTLLQSYRSKEFRKAFNHLKELPGFFPSIPRVGLSATITLAQEKEIIASLGMVNPKIIKQSPDRKNIYLEVQIKELTLDAYESYENLYKPLCDQLLKEGKKFPVTLLYMPMQYIGNAAAYCGYLFKNSSNGNLYGILCSGQDEGVKNSIISQLSTDDPNTRLVFCTSFIGMGFNSPCIQRVIHTKPPRSLSDYIQEIGRSGRTGQQANALLYYCSKDIASNIKDINVDIISYCKEKKCLREYLLRQFGFKKSNDLHMHYCCSYCKINCDCIECELFRFEM